jgi:hypothetical protein
MVLRRKIVVYKNLERGDDRRAILACSVTVQLLQTPPIQLPTATLASRTEQKTFGAASDFSWAESPYSLGQPATYKVFQTGPVVVGGQVSSSPAGR